MYSPFISLIGGGGNAFSVNLLAEEDQFEEILKGIRKAVENIEQARKVLTETRYHIENKQLRHDFEVLKKRADMIQDPDLRDACYRVLAKLEELMYIPPESIYSLESTDENPRRCLECGRTEPEVELLPNGLCKECARKLAMEIEGEGGDK